MIETQGGVIPLLCHLFLIAFTGFLDSLACLMGKNSLKTSALEMIKNK